METVIPLWAYGLFGGGALLAIAALILVAGGGAWHDDEESIEFEAEEWDYPHYPE
jgi:hypothetical protein